MNIAKARNRFNIRVSINNNYENSSTIFSLLGKTVFYRQQTQSRTCTNKIRNGLTKAFNGKSI